MTVDNAGTAATTPVRPLGTGDMAEDCAAVLAALGLEPVVAVGVSMGGAIVQELALRDPERLRGQVLVGTWPSATPYMRAAFSHLARIHREAPPEVSARALQLFIWGSDYVDEHPDELDAEVAGAVTTMAPDDFEAQVEACLGHDTRASLSRLRTPTLVTHGAEDRLVPLRLGRVLAGAVAGSQLAEFDGCGHAHHWERLAEFNTLVVDWVRERA